MFLFLMALPFFRLDTRYHGVSWGITGPGRREQQESADEDEDGWVEDEDGMQLALLLSMPTTEAGLPVGEDEVEEVDDTEEEGPCFGSCLGLQTSFSDDARSSKQSCKFEGSQTTLKM